ncbi:hypothetical protein HYY69_07675 [Candidatus Woesearchaeota archaeon]|nr:hypothetical protein [Candidatus Woesearchaeota archaeon]
MRFSRYVTLLAAIAGFLAPGIISKQQNISLNPTIGAALRGCIPTSLKEIYTQIALKGNAATLDSLLSKYDGSANIKEKDSIFEKHIPDSTSEDKRRELQVLTHMFWVEITGAVPWSVHDYSPLEIQALHDSDPLAYNIGFERSRSSGDYNPYRGSRILSETYKVYPLVKKIIGDAQSHEEAACALITWAQKNFFHYAAGTTDKNNQMWPQCDEIKVWKTPYACDNALKDPHVSIEDVFKDRGIGCHIGTMVLATMFRSINIPADYVRDTFGHASLYLPTLDRFVHGDIIAFGEAIPCGKVIMTEEELVKQTQGDYGGYNLFEGGDIVFNLYSIQLLRTQEGLYIKGNLPKKSTPALEYVLRTLSEYKIKIGETTDPNENFSDWEGWGAVTSKIVPVIPLE